MIWLPGVSTVARRHMSQATAGRKIMVERAMYWNGRGAGTDTTGGYSDECCC
ncbi:MAG: hypothetical protein JXA49_04260 [Actinobacteria bacterium]|nr:hypothetical protein [Actinomycetota bacterium]